MVDNLHLTTCSWCFIVFVRHHCGMLILNSALLTKSAHSKAVQRCSFSPALTRTPAALSSPSHARFCTAVCCMSRKNATANFSIRPFRLAPGDVRGEAAKTNAKPAAKPMVFAVSWLAAKVRRAALKVMRFLAGGMKLILVAIGRRPRPQPGKLCTLSIWATPPPTK